VSTPPTLLCIEADLSRADHAQALLRLLNEYALDPMGGGQALPAFVRANLATELRKRPSAHVLLALDGAAGCEAAVDDHAIGMLIAIEGFSTFACQPLLNVHDIIVTASHRGRGIGGQLLAQAEALARQLGCCKLTLEVLSGNLGALQAYRAAGFEPYQLDPQMGSAQFWHKKLAPAD
jgi:GNAT superfamily N-acetyltransferase